MLPRKRRAQLYLLHQSGPEQPATFGILHSSACDNSLDKNFSAYYMILSCFIQHIWGFHACRLFKIISIDFFFYLDKVVLSREGLEHITIIQGFIGEIFPRLMSWSQCFHQNRNEGNPPTATEAETKMLIRHRRTQDSEDKWIFLLSTDGSENRRQNIVDWH